MIDEAVLERLLAEMADDITVPAAAEERLLADLAHGPARRPTRGGPLTAVLAAAAAIFVVFGAAALLSQNGSSTKSANSSAAPAGAGAGAALYSPSKHRAVAVPSSPTTPPAAPGNDGAKIVKSGTLDLLVGRDDLRASVDRVTVVAVGLGGYVADSRTDMSAGAASAEVTIRVPVARFETAIARVHDLPGVTVRSESTSGNDVTAEYVDLQAQLRAATGERNQLLVLLSRANTIGDVLAVHDRLATAQTEVERLQGRINSLDAQTSFSSLAITLSEGSKAATVAPPATGLSKAWEDAREGFADVTEWLLARSGGALVVLVTLLALVFLFRYLYPLLRRALL